MYNYISWDVDPRIIPPFEQLSWYGLCWALGTLAGYLLMVEIYRKEDRPLEQIDKLAVYVLLGVIIGARLGHVLFYEPIYYWDHPIEILPIRLYPNFQFIGLRGLASHGGVIGALIALYLYHRKYQYDYLWILDRMVIAGSFLGGFIRLGNLMNSEIIGAETQVPWAFIFKRVDDLPRHPAQLYEAMAYFLIGLFLFRLWNGRRKQLKQGFLLGIGLVLIFGQRFVVEFFKKNQVAFEEELLLNMGQILSIPMVISGMILLLLSYKARSD